MVRIKIFQAIINFLHNLIVKAEKRRVAAIQNSINEREEAIVAMNRCAETKMSEIWKLKKLC